VTDTWTQIKPSSKVDRVGNWQSFSREMEEYIKDRTVAKYGGDEGPDLMRFTPPIISLWNCLKYCLRIWAGKGKEHDLHKIAHYAEITWTRLKERSETLGNLSGKQI